MKKRIFWPFLTICIMILIFMFSSENGQDSSETSGFIVTLLSILGNIENLEFFVRKAAHFSIYGFLGISIFKSLQAYHIHSSKAIILSLLFCFIYACSDELHQSFVPERSAQFSDVLLDTSGSFIFMIITNLIRFKRQRQN